MAQNDLQKAQQLIANYEFPKAISVYNDYLKTNKPDVNDMRTLADCYLKINDTKSAQECLSKVILFEDVKPTDVMNYANLLKSDGNYEGAIFQLRNYENMVPEQKSEVDGMISACEQSIAWLANPEYIDVTNLEAYNSENSDFGLVPVNKGYVFTSDRRIDNEVYSADRLYGWTGNPYLKMYFVSGNENKNTMNEITAVNDLNFKYHNGPGIYSTSENVFYYTRTKMVRVTKKPLNPDPTSWYDSSSAKDYTNRLEIYSAHFKNGKWMDITPFKYNNAEKYSIGHPAISSNGDVLYFVSDMPGGYGSTDIYYCVKNEDGSWSEPKNCGGNINTPGKDIFPYIEDDGTMYFSSDGHPGMGGLDIFSAQGSKDTWTSPVNLKSPMNSPKDDFSVYFTEPHKAGYFASNRDGGKGSDDIYSFKASPPIELIVAVTVKEKVDNKPLALLSDVTVKIESIQDNSALNVVDANDGHYYAKAGCDGSYKVSGTKDGYFAASKNIKTTCVTKHDTVFVDLVLEKIVINKPIVLKNIYYDFDKWNIRPDAAIELDKLVVILQDNPTINVELGSHTDCRGSNQYNQILSQHRAESAVEYIVSRGIAQDRITAKGYGESMLVNRCSDGVECTEAEHQENRRTEFKVTGFKSQALINTSANQVVSH